jgi:hypothetical protein
MSDMATDRITIRLGARLRRRLEAEAAAAKKRPSSVVREVLEEHFAADGPTAYELFKKAGWFNIRDRSRLPRDLSTNRKYFRGFGKSK